MKGSGNPFVHLELMTPDLAVAKKFYAAMFGWEYVVDQVPEVGEYAMFKPAEGAGGGMLTMPGAPTAWMPYAGVKDINEATDKAERLGATVVKRAVEVQERGWFSVLIDPTGACFGLWQQG
jgi:predicted enzyme related to lactoylglutathione lyase